MGKNLSIICQGLSVSPVKRDLVIVDVLIKLCEWIWVYNLEQKIILEFMHVELSIDKT